MCLILEDGHGVLGRGRKRAGKKTKPIHHIIGVWEIVCSLWNAAFVHCGMHHGRKSKNKIIALISFSCFISKGSGDEKKGKQMIIPARIEKEEDNSLPFEIKMRIYIFSLLSLLSANMSQDQLFDTLAIFDQNGFFEQIQK